jgi:hypothetical protein
VRAVEELNSPGAAPTLTLSRQKRELVGALIEQLAYTSSRVASLHVTYLPPGGQGKTHALALGAAHTSSAWLLFTDTDVQFHPQAV